MYWPDIFHKMVRRQANAFGRWADTQSTQKLLMKLYRSTRAPFGTSKFGAQVKDAKQCLVEAFKKKGPGTDLLEMLLPSIAADMGIEVSSLSIGDLARFAGEPTEKQNSLFLCELSFNEFSRLALWSLLHNFLRHERTYPLEVRRGKGCQVDGVV